VRRENGLFVLSVFFGCCVCVCVCVCVSMIFVVELKEKMCVECCGIDMCS